MPYHIYEISILTKTHTRVITGSFESGPNLNFCNTQLLFTGLITMSCEAFPVAVLILGKNSFSLLVMHLSLLPSPLEPDLSNNDTALKAKLAADNQYQARSKFPAWCSGRTGKALSHCATGSQANALACVLAPGICCMFLNRSNSHDATAWFPYQSHNRLCPQSV